MNWKVLLTSFSLQCFGKVMVVIPYTGKHILSHCLCDQGRLLCQIEI